MAKILIVDDQLTGRMVLERLASLLDTATSIRAFADPLEALTWSRRENPDLALINYRMPRMDGVEFTREFRRPPECSNVPVIIVTASDDRSLKCQALEAGATDFLTKPLDPHEFRARCRNLLTLHHQGKLLRDRAQWLEHQVEEATREVRIREQDTLLRLAKAGEFRDEDTGYHVDRMAQYCRVISENLELPPTECALIEQSSPMHDIGKIGISDTLLLKPGRLTSDEFEVLKTHTTIGYEILRGSPSQYLQVGAVIALSHHERFDGTGYPGGLSGTEIPLPARIVAVADVFDALTSRRPYKEPWPLEEALDELMRQSGRHFDPKCVEAFRCGWPKILRVYERLGDPGPAQPQTGTV